MSTSSSTVYGDATQIPTPEDYAPLKPISIYGASKLASEALITAYSYTYGFKAKILRLANIIGPKSKRGVIYDFIMKLKNDSTKLEIRGDGNQSKSYLYVNDCIEAMLINLKKSSNRVEIYNLGSTDKISVIKIAEIVREAMGHHKARLKLTGGVEGGRGWKGDVKLMQLDCRKLISRGWKPLYTSEEAVTRTVRDLLVNKSG